MRKAFTLIELLIVVAIIAILAAIAVPNFLEAQVRAKVSRAKADMRSISTGLESYHIDQNAYMKGNTESWALSFGSSLPGMKPVLELLTTPIAYMSSGASYVDPFEGTNTYFGPNLGQNEVIQDVAAARGVQPGSQPNRVYRYIARNITNTAMLGQANDNAKAVWYLLESCGPDRHYHRMGNALNYDALPARFVQLSKTLYDPTNGTVSRGSIWRGGGGTGRGSYFKDMVAKTY